MRRVDPVHPYKTPTGAATTAATTFVATLLALPLWWLLTALLEQLGALGRPLQPPDDTRLALWLGVSLLLLCWAPARRVGTGLVARFDSILLRPPSSLDLATLAASRDTYQPLRDWCFDGAGTGAAPLLRPNAIPPMERPLSFAVLESFQQPGQNARHAALNAFMAQLDGTGLLLNCGGPWAGRWLRLRIKLSETMWWRVRHPSAPWDCGFLNTDIGALARLRIFLPRRPTLIVAQDVRIDALREALASMRERQALFNHPVRVLSLEPIQMEELGFVARIDLRPSHRDTPTTKESACAVK
jgi:hypothetical protein